MKKKNRAKKQKKTTLSREEVVLTKEDFLKSLNKIILTVKKPKSPARGKSKTSE